MHEQLHLPSFLADCVAGPQANPCKAPASSVAPKPADSQQVELFDRLTKREKEVLRLVSQGQSNKVIAAGLGITEHTVKLHMHNVVGKIGVSNRTAAAHFYFEVAPFDAQSPRVG
jgi:DNA-binding NarL/FixJ family response regulator